MSFLEYLLIVIMVGLVFLPFILNYINKKKGKPTCSSGCCCCPQKNNCCKATNHIDENKNK